ncbi:MAG: outer membrane beta-barrel family protein, partial [Prevotellaceae bacterium]|nr:outer membrane beta-barrel family protein [Prevotellaceae bacterium]
GITQHLMNRKLMISLTVEDLLLTNRKSNRWTSYSNNISITQDDRWPDTRYVTLTVRYNWGVNRSIQRKRSDTDHINRL